MGVLKEMSCFNQVIQNNNQVVTYQSYTFKSYVKKHCLFLIADILKIEKTYQLSLTKILKATLIFCFNKAIKKPRANYQNNYIKLFSERYNYSITLKYYNLNN